jgi:hypothetical protein
MCATFYQRLCVCWVYTKHVCFEASTAIEICKFEGKQNSNILLDCEIFFSKSPFIKLLLEILAPLFYAFFVGNSVETPLRKSLHGAGGIQNGTESVRSCTRTCQLFWRTLNSSRSAHISQGFEKLEWLALKILDNPEKMPIIIISIK